MEGPVLSFLGMVNLPRRFPPPLDRRGYWRRVRRARPPRRKADSAETV